MSTKTAVFSFSGSDQKSKEILKEINLSSIKQINYNNSSSLIYTTNNNKGFQVKANKLQQILNGDNIINCFVDYGRCSVLTNNKFIILNREINLPEIGENDKFIKAIGNAKQTYFYLLTDLGKVFVMEQDEQTFKLDSQLNNLPFKIVDIQCGYSFTIVRCENGNCYGAGYNCYQNIGLDERTSDVKVYTLIERLKENVKQHTCGTFHTLYLTFDNEVYGCGYKVR
ncbi:hypothetical protein ABK040_013717 [Willaertia magna]